MKIVKSKEKFTKNVCECEFCYEMNRINLEFDHYEPKTKLQSRMKRVIEKLERRYK